MKSTIKRMYETFLRVRENVTARLADFPPPSLVIELLNRVNNAIARIEAQVAAQVSGHGGLMESTDSKSVARTELVRDLEAISRTARAIALSIPGLENKFRAPRSISDQALLALARAFAADALPLKEEFIKRSLPEDFLDDLANDIEAFEQAINQQIQQLSAQVAATAGLDDAVQDGVNALRELDAIMRNKYANDPAALAAWLSASHMERAPRRKTPSPAPNTPSSTPTP